MGAAVAVGVDAIGRGIVAAGGPEWDDSGHKRGMVRVLRRGSTSSWSQIGSDIQGTAERDDHLGRSVALSYDGGIVAVGASGAGGSGSGVAGPGAVKVMTTRSCLIPTHPCERGPQRARCKHTQHHRFIDSPGPPAQVFSFDSASNDWVQTGSTLSGDAVGDQFGAAVALTADGTVLAVGASYNDAGGNADAGQVKGVRIVRCD